MDERLYLIRIGKCLAAGFIIGGVAGWGLGVLSPHFIAGSLLIPYYTQRSSLIGSPLTSQPSLTGLATEAEMVRTGIAFGAVRGLFIGLAVATLLTIASVLGGGMKKKDLADG